MKTVLEKAASQAIRYLEEIQSRRVAPTADAVEKLSALDTPLPDTSNDAATTLELMNNICSPATMGVAGPRFFGFVIGGALPVTLGANWIAGAWDQNSALYNIAPATAHLEKTALRWLLDVLHLPPECGGAFVTGATMANFSALAAARHSVLEKAGWNVESDGLFGAPEIQIVVGEEVHPTFVKALGLLGFGRDRVIKVPVDAQGRMRADRLPDLSGPCIVCTQAGNVNTGAIDPIGEISRIARDKGAWVHVDGAFGLWAMAVPSMSKLAEGIDLADSWATDCHKWLNVPYDSGVAFVKNSEALRAAMAVTADYLPTTTLLRNPSDYTPELSRRARGVEVWAALHSLGRRGIIEMIERTCRHANRFAEGFRSAGFDVLNDVALNQVLITFGDAQRTLKVIDEIQKDGTCWCGSTVWQGKTAMRISVCSWATTDSDVELSLETLINIARTV